MTPLSVQDTRLSSNDRVTVAKLLKMGLDSADQPYSLDAATLGASGLSTNALVALVRANVPRLLDAEGQELRPQSMVLKQITVYASGTADFTLAMPLAA
ncbi:hypothetical protein [Aquabacterium sp.]|jgi:hypothetical protein|uniref:hypothetical protein n=1 Tax=Aquabacterium sp. TaxID=1872578 RepID=UPI0025B9FF25|nr:hypothetical protein [Aquabacterium sp.]